MNRITVQGSHEEKVVQTVTKNVPNPVQVVLELDGPTLQGLYNILNVSNRLKIAGHITDKDEDASRNIHDKLYNLGYRAAGQGKPLVPRC